VKRKQKEQANAYSFVIVPSARLERATYCSASKRSNPLSYEGISERVFYPTHLCWSRCKLDIHDNCQYVTRHSRYNLPGMVDKRPDDLSVEELRRLLLDRRKVNRRDRLENYRRSGRMISIKPDNAVPLVLRSVSDVPADEVLRQQVAVEPKVKRRSAWTDNLLLGVEVLAVLVLIGLVFNGFSILRTLNEEAAAAILPPTAAPTPLITAVVLPSGHTPPNSAQGAQPNDAEIPEHLRPLVPSLANMPVPTSSPQQALRIQIPSIKVDAPIVQGDGWEQLKKGVAQHLGTPNPGETGNVVLSAHNDIFGEIFRNLDKLQPGDIVILYTNARQFTYVITGTQIVEPTRVEVMAPTPNASVTLISCYPYLIDNQRIVVSAVLQNP
jgi:sortase A